MATVSVSNGAVSVAANALRTGFLAAVALGTTACANEPLSQGTPRFAAPMMLLSSQPANAAEAPAQPAVPAQDLAHKSLAAKVLASRALETVTGLRTDPARLSEHD